MLIMSTWVVFYSFSGIVTPTWLHPKRFDSDIMSTFVNNFFLHFELMKLNPSFYKFSILTSTADVEYTSILMLNILISHDLLLPDLRK